MSQAVDVAVVVTAVSAFLTFLYYVVQLRADQRSKDFERLFLVLREIDHVWEKRLLSEENGTIEVQRFYLGQIIVFYEAICFAANRGRLGKFAEELLSVHIIEGVRNSTQLHLALTPTTRFQSSLSGIRSGI